MQTGSLWIGYFLLFLFAINYLTYFLPLLTTLQLTSIYLALDINKPKLLDAALYGVFNLNKFVLYQV